MRKTRTIVCEGCGTTFESSSSRIRFCSSKCRKTYKSRMKFPDGSDHVECKICGFRGRELFGHVQRVHGLELEEYYAKFSCSEDSLMVKSLRDEIARHSHETAVAGKTGFQKGGWNPSHGEECKNGRRSPFSMNFSGYDGMSDEEKRSAIENLTREINQTKDENHSVTSRLDYYTSRGMTEEEAKAALSERQKTFSLKKCVERHGEAEGRRIWEERQEKWQNTLKSKPAEEIARINKLKADNCRFLHGYSNKSQRLFREIEAKIHGEFSSIFFATYHNGQIVDDGFNHEYEVMLEDNIHRFLLDFYVADNNKVIEFDGDYWHGNGEGAEKYDAERERKLRQMGFVNILRIREKDYDENPEAVVERCVGFVRE